MLLFVGLGNPTPDSENNRHNVGFKIIDCINKKFNLSKQKPKFKGLLTTGTINGKKVYVVTVNDYLAERDASWMAPIYEYFGLKVSALTSTQSFEEKKSSYESNIIYCTSSELGFDYLRDNMVLFRNQKSQADSNQLFVNSFNEYILYELSISTIFKFD